MAQVLKERVTQSGYVIFGRGRMAFTQGVAGMWLRSGKDHNDSVCQRESVRE